MLIDTYVSNTITTSQLWKKDVWLKTVVNWEHHSLQPSHDYYLYRREYVFVGVTFDRYRRKWRFQDSWSSVLNQSTLPL